MFREMRRQRQQLPREQAEEILRQGSSGVLAVAGDEGYPYAVPVSYLYHDGKIWFHCARQGHKLDAIRRNPKVSFCVVQQDRVMPAEFTSYYRSVIAFGTARAVEEPAEYMQAIRLLAEKYSPEETAQRVEDAIRKEQPALCMVEITVEHLTGKEAIELVRNRQEGQKP